MAKPKKGTEAKHPGPDLKNIIEVAEKFKALGDPTRLSILHYLIWQETQARAAGQESDSPAVTMGDISLFLMGDTEIKSSLSHHLKELRQAGLITVERKGKTKLCRVSLPSLHQLCCFLGVAVPEPVKTEAPVQTPVEDQSDNSDNSTVTVKSSPKRKEKRAASLVKPEILPEVVPLPPEE